jgi:hypothetical protein
MGRNAMETDFERMRREARNDAIRNCPQPASRRSGNPETAGSAPSSRYMNCGPPRVSTMLTPFSWRAPRMQLLRPQLDRIGVIASMRPRRARLGCYAMIARCDQYEER